MLSVGIRTYPFTLEPYGSVGIPRIAVTDTNGNRRFLPKRIRTNMNGEERISSRNKHGANLLLSVGIRWYPFTLEPSGSVVIPRLAVTDTNGNGRFLPKRIATNMNGEERISSRNKHGGESVALGWYPFVSVHAGTVWFRWYPTHPTTDTNGNGRFLPKRIATNMNREERIHPGIHTGRIRCSRLVSVRIRSRWNRLVPLLSHASL